MGYWIKWLKAGAGDAEPFLPSHLQRKRDSLRLMDLFIIGRDEIAAFHQKAFDTVLKGTSLDLTVSEMKQMDQRIWLVFAKGWHRPSDAPAGKRKAESVNIFVCKTDEEKAEVVAFQNTRARPITDKASAESWKAFDVFWER